MTIVGIDIAPEIAPAQHHIDPEVVVNYLVKQVSCNCRLTCTGFSICTVVLNQ